MSIESREAHHLGSLETAAHELATAHTVASGRPRLVTSLAALDQMPAWLDRAETALADPEAPAAKAAEWLLDNAYVVQRAVRQVGEDIPPGFYARLRPLAGDRQPDAPRIYGVAHALLRSADVHLGIEVVTRFVNAYQEVAPLDMAELWALPTMLRLACLELLVFAIERLEPSLAAPFEPDPHQALPPSLEDSECVARAIRGLVVIAAISWKECFRRTSLVEAELQHDPVRAYRHMDFATADRYRKVVEELARATRLPEAEVARRAVAEARRAGAGDGRRAHVGYWLIDEGRPRLEALLGYHVPRRQRWRRRLARHTTALYLLALLLTTAVAAAVPAAYLYSVSARPAAWIVAMLLALLPASALAVTAVHGIVTLLVPNNVLPKLAFDGTIPHAWKTAVVIPTLLTNRADVPYRLRRLERHFLANPDPALQFALLTDFADAPAHDMPGDDVLVQDAIAGIRALNAKHGASNGPPGPFHLLHRERRYNDAEGCWMGWERKRGKLEEFNRLLAGERATSYVVREGDPAGLSGVRLVITLDTDTLLPQGAAARLVGILAHPLNRPDLDPHTGAVRAGYTVVQPRVAISPDSGNRSWFARLYSGDTSIDIYSRAVSDVYQDLFGAGIYVGKGIYDAAAFRRSVADRMPENAIASHDLLEGIHGRAALASDVVLYEDYPSQFLAGARRLHRWTRGDWQLLPWLGRRVPGADGRVPNRLSAIDRWKIADNLRRTLLPLSRLLLLVAGWFWLPGSPLVWTLLGALAPGDSLVSDLGTTLARGGARRSCWGLLAATRRRVKEHAGRWLLLLVFLPHEAVVTTDAILRTLVRLVITRRRLLQWTSAARTAAALRRTPRALVWREMAAAPAIAAATGLAAATWYPDALPSALPLLALWLVSPEIAILISRPIPPRVEHLGADDLAFVRTLARRTWLFFETFVGPDDQWLPPDNYQEEPIGEIAHRTSPTNVGMMFLSTLAAWDLGYLGVAELSFRVRSSLDTMTRLEHHRGHLLNWYDSRTLEPLLPRYVSTVDSGNLAAALIALRQGCLETAQEPVLRPQRWDGLIDAVRLVADALARLSDGGDAPLRARVYAIRTRAAEARNDPSRWARTITDLCVRECDDLDRLLLETVKVLEARGGALDVAALRELRIWFERMQHHLRSMHRELALLAPWLALLDAPPAATDGAFDEDVGRLRELLAPTVTLDAIPARCVRAHAIVAGARRRTAESGMAAEMETWLTALEQALASGAESAATLHTELLDAAARAGAVAGAMDFRILYDQDSRHFQIGYNVSAERMDPHHYDLLASEARLASFVAIANGDVPVEHWFALGRAVTRTGGTLALLSWGGTMFEYLMPALLLHSHDDSLLAQSEHGAIDAQIDWGKRHGVPWGVSESGYALVDAEQHYQYRAFGVPALGLRRDPLQAVVVAPYATALALPRRPRAAVQNLRRLAGMRMVGTYGLYEALDCTPAHLPPGRASATVRSYMAHHQGMILAALDNHLHADAFVRRFHADPRVQTAELVLHERVPLELPGEVVRREGAGPAAQPRERGPTPQPWTPRALVFPAAHVFGNGRLSCVITEGGAGALRWQGRALTRWTPDPTCDDTGLWIYVRDDESGACWSAGRQPTGVEAEEAEVLFHAHMAELRRRDHGIALAVEIAISPSDDVEIRRVVVTNETDRRRRLTFTSYAEVVLASAADDERHPAFNKLFVRSEHVAELDALLFTRRARRPDERPPVLMHRVVAGGAAVRVVGVETDRARFLGRNGNMRAPQALRENLSGTVGTTLDAIMCLRAAVELAPHGTEELAFVTVVGGSRESVLETAERYGNLGAIEWTATDAAAGATRELRTLGLDPARLPDLETVLSTLLYAPPDLRCAPPAIVTNRLGQPRLWGMGISGDLPVLLLRLGDPRETALLEDLVRVHRLWQRRGVGVDLVVLWEGVSGYEDTVSGRLLGVLQELGAPAAFGGHGGVHLIRGDQVRPEERQLLEVTARAVLAGDGRSLAQQFADLPSKTRSAPRFVPNEPLPPPDPPGVLERPRDLRFDNGSGGFSADGREYVIHLAPGESTPAPWCNVLANPELGCLVTEAGGGYTWSVNSAEHRLTPWRNDPVSDTPAEVLYLRDEENAEVWTPTPRPRGADAACEIRHGAGYSTWRRNSHALEQTLTVFVAPDEPVKVVRLHLVNSAARARRITATYYGEWVLGTGASASRPFVVGEYDAGAGALLARSAWDADFGERIAFLASDRAPHGFTTDRREFLGREGDVRAPAALASWGLSGTTPAGCDPCAALQVHVELAPGAQTDVFFLLGEGRDRPHAEDLLRRWRDPRTADAAWQALTAYWDRILGAVTVRTPDPAMDVMLNRWLLYQTLAARLFARTGLYQSAGAFGFRDQLQDVMALVHADAALARAHVLACAERQFEDGDVLHWWHPGSDKGVRTRCSDDLLWLPYVTAHYVEATGDLAILDVTVPFLTAPPLAAEEHDRYARFEATTTRWSLYEHCRRALQRGVTSGPHGLPLIGDGDWNDAMSRVGARGRGESVWLAWFAIATMRSFAGLCERRDDRAEAGHWRERARDLAESVEREAWDGAWYRRAFDDDGIPWGSATSGECCIDSVSQSWAALSGAGAPARVRQALEAAERALVRPDDRVVCLLWPPFDTTARDPGYIKAYPPGIRENGGQYSHAAAWLGWAFAAGGDGDRAARIFRLLNPITHATTHEDASRYRVEPYVVTADVGSVAPHVGRGGWTWYTGAAAWTWRLGVEAILGLQRNAGRLRIDPCVPREWPGFTAIIRSDGGTLEIQVENPDGVNGGVAAVSVDGVPMRGRTVDLPSDGRTHRVHVRLGEPDATAERLAALHSGTGG